MNTKTKTETGTETTACLLWARVGAPSSVEEKTFSAKEESAAYVRALRRRGRTAWLKGDRRYAKIEALGMQGKES